MRRLAVGFAILVVFFLLVLTLTQETGLERGDVIFRFDVPTVNHVAWNHDLSMFAVLAWEQIFIWDTEDWQLLVTIPDALSYEIAWHPAENLIAGLNCCQDEKVSIWNGETGELHKQLVRQTIEGILILQAFDWSPDSQYIASDSFIGTIVLWDWEAGTYHTLVPSEPILHDYTSLSYSPTGAYLLSGGYDGTIRVWDAQSGEHILVVEGYKHTAWHPDETHFAGAGPGNRVNVWNLEDGQVEMAFTAHTHTITSVDWNIDGSTLASTDADGNLFVWEFSTGAQVLLDLPDDLFVSSAHWRPDGLQLAITTNDEVIIMDW